MSKDLASVYNLEGKVEKTVHIPSVIRNSPIRPDVVEFVHVNLSKNHRQPYARYNRAGHQHSAESWGTGRAVARVPRISGSGTSTNGSGAFANMTRGGRMFAPLKVWRRWNRIVNINQKRFAMCSAIAASSVPALVLARGHRINNVPEIPLIVSDDAEKIKKTKEAVKIINALHLRDDVERSAKSRKIRPGKGKMRNRRYVQKKGLLVIHNFNNGLSRAFRNIPGVNCINVNRLNLKEMAPGGHIGRFVLWTESAFKKLDQLYGTYKRDATLKAGYRHPKSEMTMTDIKRIIQMPHVKKYLVHNKHRKPYVPKVRKHLLLTRKIRRSTILNSKAKQAHKAKLDKLREAGKLPKIEKKEQKPRKHERTDPLGRPLVPKERVAYYKKKLEEAKKKAIEGKKQKHEERVKAQVALAKAKKESRAKAHAKLLERQKKQKENRIKQKKATAEIRKKKFEEKAKLYKKKQELKKKALAAKKKRIQKRHLKQKEAAKAKAARGPNALSKKEQRKADKKKAKKEAKEAAKAAKKEAKKDAKKN